MFGFSWAELLLIGVVAMVFIGPKDFPKVMRWFSDVVKKCRQMANEFHSQVDEVIKDPDLKEAKDQFMQLRNMNVKGAILNAIDRDGSIQQTFRDPALSSSTALPDFPTKSSLELKNDEIDSVPTWQSEIEDQEKEESVDFEALEEKDPAPMFFPPPIAQRMQVKRSSPPSPAMIPPQIARYKEQRWS